MMKAKEDGKGTGRDTTVCGDPKIWYPMRVTYSREMKVKGELDRLEIEKWIRFLQEDTTTSKMGHFVLYYYKSYIDDD